MEVVNSREAIETILTHTSRPVDLIRRKSVTKEVVRCKVAKKLKNTLQVIFKYLHAEKGPVRLKASENKAMHMARWILNSQILQIHVHFPQSITFSQKVETRRN